MSSNEQRMPPKSATRGTNRRTGGNPVSANTVQSQSIRDTQYHPQYSDEDDLLMEDDPYASNPPRPPSSAIRLNKPSPQTRRAGRDVTTETQSRRAVQVPYAPTLTRRTQKPELAPVPPQQQAARPARSTTTASYNTPAVPKTRRHIHWLLYVGIGMIAALALWELGASAINWGTSVYNNAVYGYPRTSQVDAVVGHNDSAKNPSHFIALNLHGQVIIVEFPGGDPSKAIDYTGPKLFEPGEDQIPITLSFADMNHDGMPDMIVHIGDQDIVFYNNGKQFITQPSGSNQPAATATP